MHACSACGRVSERRRCDEHWDEPAHYGPHFDQNRLAVLKRDPICTICGKRRSTVAHHTPFTRRRLIAMGVKDPDGLEWLEGACRPCHGVESGRGK